MGQQKRLAQIGNIRALAILLVVSVHSIILYSADWGLYETTRQAPFLAWLEKLMVIPPMPLFFSLSGYLFVLRTGKSRALVNRQRRKFFV